MTGPGPILEGSARRPESPLDLLVVGWFPAADDPIAGRFVADQVAALAATGRVTPSVVSFEPFWPNGDLDLRTRAAEAWLPAVSAATASGWAVAAEGATGPAAVPVMRLGAASGSTRDAGGDHQALHRAHALEAYLEARGGAPWPLIHAHVGYPEGAAVAEVALARGIPFVITEHATYLARFLSDPALREAYGRAARAAARVIAVGPGLARQIVEAYPELGERVVVIPNTVDVAALPLVGLEARDPNELLWVGYRTASKGIPTLLRAFALVRRARPATTLRLLGRSPTEEEEVAWHRLAGELGVAEAVRFEGPADRAGVAAALARATLFVHPSSRETFGIVAVEALATGLPVVAADSGGVTEILGDDPAQLGALVPSGDPEALAEAILATLARRSTFDPAALRASVAGRFDRPAVAAQLVDLYEQVLREQRASPSTSPVARSAGPTPRGDLGRQPTAGPVVIVAFDRPALDATLPRWPAWVLRDALIVTRGPQLPQGRVLAADLEVPVSTLLAWADRPRADSLAAKAVLPLRLRARRRQRARLERLVLPALEAAVEAAVDEVRARSDGPVLVVCLGGIDVLATGRAVRTGRARIAPGGLRWLGDLRWPGTSSQERAAETSPAEAEDQLAASSA